jgi:hypothetical protein
MSFNRRTGHLGKLEALLPCSCETWLALLPCWCETWLLRWTAEETMFGAFLSSSNKPEIV